MATYAKLSGSVLSSGGTAAQLTGSTLTSPGATTTTNAVMYGSVLSSPGPVTPAGRYRLMASGAWKRHVRYRWTGTNWSPYEYGTPPYPFTIYESWATTDRNLWPFAWEQYGNGSATIASHVGYLTPGPGAYTAGWQVAYYGRMQALTDWEFDCNIGFAGGNVEQYVAVGMAATADRKSGQPVPQNGYSVQFFPSAGGFNVNRSVASTITNLSGTVAYTYTAGNIVNLMMTKNGSVLQVWVWDAGTAQPSTPTWSGSDSAPYTGACRPYLCATNGSAGTARLAKFDNFNCTPYSVWSAAAALATAMPTGDITLGTQNWHQIYAQDFTTNISVGGFVPQASGTLAGYLNQGHAADTPYGSQITVYPEGYGAGSTGTSRPVEILDVANSCLRWNFAIDPTYGNMAATVHPLIGPSYFIDPAGIRIHMRFHVSGSVNLAGLGCVIQLISDPTTWASYHGEMDAMEGDLSLQAQTNWHPQQATNATYLWGQQNWTDAWHDLVIEWLPSRETVYIDNVKIGETTTLVSTHPRAFLIQTGWNTTPASTQSGQLLVDWITAYTPA